MSEHTPGPWIADGPPDNIHILQASNTDMRVCFLTSDGPTEANGRLIAAAPDLLEALQAVLRACTELSDAGLPSPGPAIRSQVRAAIAKATAAPPQPGRYGE